MASKQAPRSYLQRLLSELDTIADDYVAIIEQSGIRYVNPNRSDSDFFFLGAADWGWAPSTPELEAARMALLQRVRDWEPRFRLLFPHPTPEPQGPSQQWRRAGRCAGCRRRVGSL